MKDVFVALLALVAGLVACGPSHRLPPGLLYEGTRQEENAPLGGDALAHRKLEMQRAYRDLIHFHATFESLFFRRDRSGQILFSEFVGTYMGTHLDPILRNEWQSHHPELMGLDANLRFVQAEVLMQMRDPAGAEAAIEEIERRFQGRENMLVDYPIGEQSTLAEGLEILRDRKWRG
jgi:hypothetical protein